MDQVIADEIDATGPAVWWIAALLVASATAPLACQSRPPETQELERTVDYHIEAGNREQTLRRKLLEDLRDADERIWAAVADDAIDAEIAGALTEAASRGLDVRVVGDADDRDDEAFQAIVDSEIETTFGDGELSYLPDPTLSQVAARCRLDESKRVEICTTANSTSSPCSDGSVQGGQGAICRPGSFNRMSHRFFIIDERTVWNFAGGFDKTAAGNLGWRADSELIREDFEREFRQMLGGVFSTTLDVFNGPVKSGTDDNIEYSTDHGMLEIRFNPQERLMKHVIDEVYRARSSIQITAPSIRNPFLLDALEYKKNNGFTVQIVVGKGEGNGGQPPGSAKERLRELGARSHAAGSGVPSVLVVDGVPADGEPQWPRTGMALSHPLWHAQPFEVIGAPQNAMDRSDRVKVYPSDHFVDGNLWKLYEYSSNAGGAPHIDQMQSFVQTAWKQASDL